MSRTSNSAQDVGRIVLEQRDDGIGVEKVIHPNRSSGGGIGGFSRPPSMNGTSPKRSSSANHASTSVTIGSSRIPLSTRRTRTRSPGRRNASGKRTAWLRPCMKIFAMPVLDMGSTDIGVYIQNIYRQIL